MLHNFLNYLKKLTLNTDLIIVVLVASYVMICVIESQLPLVLIKILVDRYYYIDSLVFFKSIPLQ